MDLSRQIEVRSHGERHPLPALAVLEAAQLDDRTGLAIAGCLDVGKLDMVGAPVCAVDHGIGGAGELIVKAAFDQATDDRFGRHRIMKREGTKVGNAPVMAHRAVHRLDNVAADREVAKRLLGIRPDRPCASIETVGQADRCLARAGDWEVAGEATVFHELVDGAGVLVRRALYSLSVRATVNALLASGGHHRSIGAVAGYLRNQGGFVRFRDLDWELSHAIAADATRAIGDEAGRALVDG